MTKNSAFYKRDSAAPIARGLFSFWNTALYLYGAMLTQGEENSYCKVLVTTIDALGTLLTGLLQHSGS